jgi:hypothetical protein
MARDSHVDRSFAAAPAEVAVEILIDKEDGAIEEGGDMVASNAIGLTVYCACRMTDGAVGVPSRVGGEAVGALMGSE